MFAKLSLSGLMLAAAMVTAASAQDFRLTSTSIAEGAQLAPAHVFTGFGCEGGNTSPHLSWTGAPAGTKSFAITAYDPDAPTGSGWWHWTAVNIPASVTSLEAGASGAGKMPAGTTELANDYGAAGFGGACPPPGEVHRYIFTVHALPVERLDLPENASNALAGFMIRANAIASAKITAVYNR
ncbi:YbhB/YbcL family Raf kinase inhibitor-like protein [Pannonibacter phragmitetus]|uniref:YbhB/YbcL family Raf kinase inhibitor-like protein n=1 Tax=Pannonibacter phragmitetus TaxID=121719 RepID=UPI000F03DD8E|nr:YbhB/YbcL family Raf kinase inhibitor-like protein [Pannonibacter phragmitetus]